MNSESIDKAVSEHYKREWRKVLSRAEKISIKRKPPAKARAKAHKARVQAATRKLISNGELARTACAICGDLPTEAHHPVYDEEHPDRVVFLCKYHHSIAHYYQQLHTKGEVASITQNCVLKYHKDYKKTHEY